MKLTEHKQRWIIVASALIVILAAFGGVAYWRGWIRLPGAQNQRPQQFDPQQMMDAGMGSVPIQPAELLIEELQLTGKLKLQTVREVTAPFEEAIDSIDVTVGDRVLAGDSLLVLDRDQLEVDLDSAWLDLMEARENLVEISEPATELELLDAQTQLMAAQEALSTVDEGPTASDVNASALAVREAEVAMEELLGRNDPNSTEVRQARYNLKQAENSVQDAQMAYDAVSWKGAGASSEASALQSATIALEKVRLAYEEAIAPPDQLELDNAQLAIDQAKTKYTDLFEESTPAEVAQAELKVAQAEDNIVELLAGPTEVEIQEAEAAVLLALTTFEETRRNLMSGSAVVSPLDGLVTRISVVEGQVVERGDTVAVVAALDSFEINLTVSEEYILLLEEGMPVDIVVDVAPNQPVSGYVSYISPVDTNSFTQGQTTSFESGSTSPGSYPVTIQVNPDPGVDDLRAGMNVQVTFIGSSQLPEYSWLVPSNSIIVMNPEDDSGVIQIVRGETTQEVAVTITDITQGEWQVVVSDELTQGDRVIGSTATFLDDSSGMFMGGDMGGMQIMAPSSGTRSGGGPRR